MPFISPIIHKKVIRHSRARKARTINIAQTTFPLSSSDRVPYNMLLHKCLTGHVLIALNSLNVPVRAWTDMVGVLGIKAAKLADSMQFRKVIDSHKPHVLYLNDGAVFGHTNTYNISVYSNKSLFQILEHIKINAPPVITSDILTFVQARELDPTLTRQQYKKLCKNYTK